MILLIPSAITNSTCFAFVALLLAAVSNNPAQDRFDPGCEATWGTGRDEQKLYFYFNIALGSVSMAKLTLWAILESKKEVLFSMHNIKQYFCHKYLTETIFTNLELDLSCRKINRLYHQCLDIGHIAA